MSTFGFDKKAVCFRIYYRAPINSDYREKERRVTRSATKPYGQVWKAPNICA